MTLRWRKRLFLCLICCVVSQGCARPGQAPAADTAAVKRTLMEFSAALAAGDQARLRALTTSSFLLVDEGTVFDFAAMMASVQKALASGKMKRTPAALRTEIRQDVAWAQYRVTGEFRNADGALPLNLLETAVLERAGGQWRVALVTTLPAATTK